MPCAVEPQLTAGPGRVFQSGMTKDGSSSVEQVTGGGRLLGRLGCALRGGHVYTASRKLDGLDTCRRCGHRRLAAEDPWFEPPAQSPTASGGGRKDGVRPVAALGCAMRGYHNFVPSHRMEGYDTCLQCGRRRKTPESTWFAKPPHRQPSQAAVDAGPIATPTPSDVIVSETRQDTGEAAGVDPRVLRDFLRQVDSGVQETRPESGGAGQRRGAKPRKT